MDYDLQIGRKSFAKRLGDRVQKGGNGFSGAGTCGCDRSARAVSFINYAKMVGEHMLKTSFRREVFRIYRQLIVLPTLNFVIRNSIVSRRRGVICRCSIVKLYVGFLKVKVFFPNDNSTSFVCRLDKNFVRRS